MNKMKNKKYYTGVGSRETPLNILNYMIEISKKLEKQGYIIRSGGANGADMAFEKEISKENKEIYLPWKGFNENKSNLFLQKFNINIQNEAKNKAIETMGIEHWNNLSDAAKKLHTRNVFQVLGEDLKTKSNFLICWTKKGTIKGGTATAIRLALKNKIKVFNLGTIKGKENLEKYIYENN